MLKQMTFAIHYTHNENENKILSVFIASENIKFALKKFEKKFPNCSIITISRVI